MLCKEALDTFGVDAAAGLPTDNDTSDAVIVPPTPCPLDPEISVIFEQRISHVIERDPWDTEPYIYAIRALGDLLNGDQS